MLNKLLQPIPGTEYCQPAGNNFYSNMISWGNNVGQCGFHDVACSLLFHPSLRGNFESVIAFLDSCELNVPGMSQWNWAEIDFSCFDEVNVPHWDLRDLDSDLPDLLLEGDQTLETVDHSRQESVPNPAFEDRVLSLRTAQDIFTGPPPSVAKTVLHPSSSLNPYIIVITSEMDEPPKTNRLSSSMQARRDSPHSEWLCSRCRAQCHSAGDFVEHLTNHADRLIGPTSIWGRVCSVCPKCYEDTPKGRSDARRHVPAKCADLIPGRLAVMR